MELIITDRNKEHIKSIKIKNLQDTNIHSEILKFSRENGNIELFDFEIKGEVVIKTQLEDYKTGESLGCLFG